MDTICWNNLQAARKAYAQAIEPVCQKWGLNRAEMDVLLFLADNPERDRATDVVEYQGYTKSHVSVAVKVLCEKGLLEAVQDGTDRRVMHLKVTEEAARIIDDGTKARDSFFCSVFRDFSNEELAQFRGLLKKIGENILSLGQQ